MSDDLAMDFSRRNEAVGQCFTVDMHIAVCEHLESPCRRCVLLVVGSLAPDTSYRRCLAPYTSVEAPTLFCSTSRKKRDSDRSTLISWPLGNARVKMCMFLKDVPGMCVHPLCLLVEELSFGLV